MTILPEIDVIKDVCTPRDIFDRRRTEAGELLKICYKTYTKTALSLADIQSRKWLDRVNPPYADDVRYISAALGGKGIYTLNLSYEWGCTTTACNDRDNGGVKLYRSMDWPIEGMAGKLVVAKQAGPAGEFWNLTWPGFAGVLNGHAPGRFSIAINQAPIPKHTHIMPLDWILARRRTFSSGGLPGPFLLRKVFEECTGYDQAVAMLSKTELCIPALFTVAGVNPGQHCIIERRYGAEAAVHTDRIAVANHWLNADWKGHDRPPLSRERQAKMAAEYESFKGGFDWLVPPVLNGETRLAFEANPKTGGLKVRALEGERVVSRTLEMP